MDKYLDENKKKIILKRKNKEGTVLNLFLNFDLQNLQCETTTVLKKKEKGKKPKKKKHTNKQGNIDFWISTWTKKKKKRKLKKKNRYSP